MPAPSGALSVPLPLNETKPGGALAGAAARASRVAPTGIPWATAKAGAASSTIIATGLRFVLREPRASTVYRNLRSREFPDRRTSHGPGLRSGGTLMAGPYQDTNSVGAMRIGQAIGWSVGIAGKRDGGSVHPRRDIDGRAQGACRGVRLRGIPAGPGSGDRSASGRKERARRDADGLWQVAVFPGPGADHGWTHGRGIAAGRAHAGPGGGAPARRCRGRQHQFRKPPGRKRRRLEARRRGEDAAPVHGPGTPDDRPDAGSAEAASGDAVRH